MPTTLVVRTGREIDKPQGTFLKNGDGGRFLGCRLAIAVTACS
jgi:hypothetical protein